MEWIWVLVIRCSTVKVALIVLSVLVQHQRLLQHQLYTTQIPVLVVLYPCVIGEQQHLIVVPGISYDSLPVVLLIINFSVQGMEMDKQMVTGTQEVLTTLNILSGLMEMQVMKIVEV